jgi:hypothetical protein
MKSKKILDEVGRGVRITVEVMEGDPSVHDYGIPRTAWTDRLNRERSSVGVLLSCV